MPVNYQIVPKHKYPHQMVQANDNTEVIETYSEAYSDDTALLCVFSSPKGRDNKVLTIRGGANGFVEEFGLGSFAQYGQPLLNAYLAARSGSAVIHAMRVTAEDASYSNTTIIAKYKIVTDSSVSDAIGNASDGDTVNVSSGTVSDPVTITNGVTVNGASAGESENHDQTTDSESGESATVSGKLVVKFYAKSSDEELTDLDNFETACTIAEGVDEAGFTTVKLFSVAALGKGVYGQNLHFRLTTDRASDKENPYKNYYFGTYTVENTLDQKEQFSVSFDPDSYYNGKSLFADEVITDADNGSTRLAFVSFPEGFKALYDAYLSVCPDTDVTESEFDALFGLNKVTAKALPNYEIIAAAADSTAATDEEPASFSSTEGIALTGGSDGSLAASVDAATRQATLNALYLKAFKGEIDEQIKSKNRFPTNFMLDANYPVDVKLQMVALATQRGDCFVMLDCGTGITTKASVYPYCEENFGTAVDSRTVSIEGYAMKWRDPYSKKTVNVTSTAWLAARYPSHIQNYGGKHRPLAGNTFGVIAGYVTNSLYPLFDEDLDSELMDQLAENHINFAKYNPNQVTVRATQDTHQSRQTNLSEQNNVMILLDVKRDCERLCARNEYDFSDVSDIARFNASLDSIIQKYQSAQVTNIEARFDKNKWESERNIIHLYVSMIHKDLVRTTIIEIDVNRANTEV